MNQALAHLGEKMAKVPVTKQAIDLMCRIDVSDINVEVGEEELKTMFGPFGPLKSVSVFWDPITQKNKGQESLYFSAV